MIVLPLLYRGVQGREEPPYGSYNPYAMKYAQYNDLYTHIYIYYLYNTQINVLVGYMNHILHINRYSVD
jgi:hypothetical protein